MSVQFEGYTIEEILALPDATLQAIVLCNEALVFRVGSAEILGRFTISEDALLLELGHIDGGGEGSLPALAALAKRYAMHRELAFIEWRVHAVHCAKPNLKLRRVLERKGFVVRSLDDVGECYWLRESVTQQEHRISAVTVGDAYPGK